MRRMWYGMDAMTMMSDGLVGQVMRKESLKRLNDLGWRDC